MTIHFSTAQFPTNQLSNISELYTLPDASHSFNRISSAIKGFEQRWANFIFNKKLLPLWTADWTEAELQVRYDQMIADRWKIYFVNPEDRYKKDAIGRYNEMYQTPENWESWQSRYPFPLAFAYNLALPNYNASILKLNEQLFLAIEAPSSKNSQAFFDLFDEYDVTHLVRLTPEEEHGENFFPYWRDCSDQNHLLHIATKIVRFFPCDWPHHEGLGPKELLHLVQEVIKTKEIEKSSYEMLAVSCRGGVGRTCSFIAAYALITEINQQITKGVDIHHLEINIDKVVYELCIQRPFAVANYSQYLALYQLVSFYINELQSQKSFPLKV